MRLIYTCRKIRIKNANRIANMQAPETKTDPVSLIPVGELKNKLPGKLVVTMTSWTKRIHNVINVVKRVFENTVTPDIMYLNLSVEEFPEKELMLPKDLCELVDSEERIVINWVDGPDTKVFKKVYPILEYLDDEDVIVQIDDDISYPVNFIENMVKDFIRYDCPITCNEHMFNSLLSGKKILFTCGALSLTQKKHHKDWEVFVNEDIIKTYEDDWCSPVIIEHNGYSFKKSSVYKFSDILAWQKKNFYGNDILHYNNTAKTKDVVKKRIEELNWGIDEKKKINAQGSGKSKLYLIHWYFSHRDLLELNSMEIFHLNMLKRYSICEKFNKIIFSIAVDDIKNIEEKEWICKTIRTFLTEHNVEIIFSQNDSNQSEWITYKKLAEYTNCDYILYTHFKGVTGKWYNGNDIDNLELNEKYWCYLMYDGVLSDNGYNEALSKLTNHVFYGSILRTSGADVKLSKMILTKFESCKKLFKEKYLKIQQYFHFTGTFYWINMTALKTTLNEKQSLQDLFNSIEKVNGQKTHLSEFFIQSVFQKIHFAEYSRFVNQKSVNLYQSYTSKVYANTGVFDEFNYSILNIKQQKIKDGKISYINNNNQMLNVILSSMKNNIDILPFTHPNVNYFVKGLIEMESTSATTNNSKIKDFESHYFKCYKRKPNLSNPSNFVDYWAKRYIIDRYYDNLYYLADKIAVRDYISDLGYSDLLVPILGVYENENDIDFNNLPKKFVLKLNTGSGLNIICKDKSKLNIADAKKKMNTWLKMTKFVPYEFEDHYSKIKPKILIEQFIEGFENDNVIDYKFHCHNGYVDFILVCSDRTGHSVKISTYDREWNEIEYIKPANKQTKKIPKPANLETMISIAENIAKGIELVRVDLYTVNDKIYFGEITLSPAAFLFHYLTDYGINTYLSSYINEKRNEVKTDSKVVVYSFCTNNTTNLPFPTIKFKQAGLDYVMFTDNVKPGEMERQGWKLIQVPSKTDAYKPQDINKDYKWHPFREFADKYDYSIYIDSKVEMLINPLTVVNNFKSRLKHGFTAYKYDYQPLNWKSNYLDIYKHIDYLIGVKVGNIENMKKWKRQLAEEKYPQNGGVCECAVILTDLHNDDARKIQEEIFDKYIEVNTQRDQIIVPYILWKNNININECNILGSYCKESKYFKNNKRTNVNGRDNKR